MGKRTVFTNITPLPPQVSREVAIAMIQNHGEMIELNPLVVEHHPISTPRDAAKDEFLDCAWYEISDKIPVGPARKKVTYKGCFYNLPNGLQTHVYAPLGLDIRERWTICGALPGEPDEPRELGMNTPRRGLYLREDAEIKVSILMTGYVRKNLDAAHKVLVERILAKAERIQGHLNRANSADILGQQSITAPVSQNLRSESRSRESSTARQISNGQFRGSLSRISHARTSSDSAAMRSARSPLREDWVQELPASTPRDLEKPLPERPQIDESEIRDVHPALRQQYIEQRASRASTSDLDLPIYNTLPSRQEYFYGNDKVKTPVGRAFVSELEGSTPESSRRSPDSVTSSDKGSIKRETPGYGPSAWRPQTTYGPVSEISDEMPPYQDNLRSHSLTQNYPVRHSEDVSSTQSRSSRAVDRFSVVSGISDLPTPKPEQNRFDNGVDRRFSAVSDLSEEPTPKFKQQTFAFAQEQARLAEQRHRDNFM